MVSRQCVSTSRPALCVYVTCIAEDTKTIKTLEYQNQLLLLKTADRYRCDVIVRDHPTDLGVVLLVIVCAAAAGGDVRPGSSRVRTCYVIVCCRQEVIWKMALVAGSSTVAVTNG